ncbi:2Fe-2S iron-sulfur cluster-binding protein [Marinobacterium arenosum]|uniref:2Fe-2S iron-sulfur cluster-binding protein n=1 Tax=Marinobacterium arenosum TaxID=2862496 RepID=UPI001C96A191|nr:2Fe-2S iron-sulfur cluster-binding protein [Marinobacterium arenosum]MBY4676941.1 2Fe-2S iron-sulfur cluster binding domain-containing protein [Marinobacterium arenosum]
MGRAKFYALPIRSLHRSTPEAISITFDLPQQLQPAFRFKAGQHLCVEAVVDGDVLQRYYSLTNSPALAEPFAITVKQMPNGRVSRHLNQALKVGDTLRVAPPSGNFTPLIQPDNRCSYYLFAAGSGITPLLSILKTVLSVEPESRVYLLYGNRDENHIILHQELNDWQRRHPDRLLLLHCLSQPRFRRSWPAHRRKTRKVRGRVGRIDDGTLNWFLDRYPPTTPHCCYLICGPTGMMDSCYAHLRRHGIAERDIQREYFSLEHAIEPAPDSSLGQSAIVDLELDGRDYKVRLDAGETILQALQRLNVDAPFSCQAGICGTCRAELLAGQVQMVQHPALNDQQVEDGEILMCQSRPLSDQIRIRVRKH